MNMKVMVILVMALFLIAGCGDDKTEVKQDTQPPGPGDSTDYSGTEEADDDSDPMGTASTLREMFDLGTKAKCTYSVDNEGATTEGSLWINGEKFRSEAMMNGEKVYSIFDGSTYYAWSESQDMGVMFTKDFVDQAEGMEGVTVQSKDTLIEGAYDVDCSSTGIMSTKLFQPPSDVQFKDMGELIKQMEEMMQGFDQN